MKLPVPTVASPFVTVKVYFWPRFSELLMLRSTLRPLLVVYVYQ